LSRGNQSLTKLDQRLNRIGAAGGTAIAEALEVNGTLTDLNLWDNSIGTS
jgi:hypothetical protein